MNNFKWSQGHSKIKRDKFSMIKDKIDFQNNNCGSFFGQRNHNMTKF